MSTANDDDTDVITGKVFTGDMDRNKVAVEAVNEGVAIDREDDTDNGSKDGGEQR
jgi:hypothetical protein